jgi:hypothetical protein
MKHTLQTITAITKAEIILTLAICYIMVKKKGTSYSATGFESRFFEISLK